MIKRAVRKKNRLYRKYNSSTGNREDEENLCQATEVVSEMIVQAKERYFLNLGNKLNDPMIGPKAHWSILKQFLNKIKIPSIPPLLVNGILETNFLNKANIFNKFCESEYNFK